LLIRSFSAYRIQELKEKASGAASEAKDAASNATSSSSSDEPEVTKEELDQALAEEENQVSRFLPACFSPLLSKHLPC
jgi:hypothetical protein